MNLARMALHFSRACLALLLAGAALGTPPSRADEEVAQGDARARDILARAESIRFPESGFQMDIDITTTQPDTEPELRSYRLLSNGNTQTLVQTTAPAIDRNQILLMRDRDLWAFLPNLSQPIRLPLSQRLTGQVSNGDLARANFVGDYTPSLLRSEKVDGETHHVLQLDAVDRWVTYHKVLYWVNARNYRPLKAEFYTVSGRLLKTCHYQKYKPMLGEQRPSQLVIEDAVRAGHKSVLDYANMVARNLPERVFTKDYLKKLSR